MEQLPVFPAFQENNLAITMQTSDFFSPYAAVTALSVIENASPDYHYDIIFMTWDMREETEKKLLALSEGRSNVSVRVVNVRKALRPYEKIAQTSSGFGRFSYTGMLRLLLPQLLEHYSCVLNLDCDMLVRSDVSELFRYDLSDCCMAAVPDIICYTLNHCPEENRYSDEHMLGSLGLRSAAEYINGGLLLLNLQMIRKSYTTAQIMDFAVRDGIILRCYEQDVFGGLFQDKKLRLSFEWNWFNDMPRLIGPFAKYLPADDPYLEAHRKAESHIKNIHYVTEKKPWLTNIVYPHAKEWWEIARRSPFLDEIMARATADNLQGANKIAISKNPRLLFYCASGYQLLNALNIKCRYYSANVADILLDGKELAKYEDRLERTGLFHNVLPLGCDLKGKTDIPSLMDCYSDFFAPDSINSKAWSVLGRLNRSKQVAVHLYEGGGCGAYTLNFSQALAENDNAKQVKDIFLYDLTLHSNRENPFPLIQLPEIGGEDKGFTTVLGQVFGSCPLPRERYIFLQESFAEEGFACNDSILLDAVTDVVGRENIAVRLHPNASPVNERLYQLHGYSVYPADGGLWEMAAFRPELEDKVLLSVSSTALISPCLAFGCKARIVSLFELMPLSRRIKNDGEYRDFLYKLQAEMGNGMTMLSRPKSVAELRMVLRFIEGVM